MFTKQKYFLKCTKNHDLKISQPIISLIEVNNITNINVKLIYFFTFRQKKHKFNKKMKLYFFCKS